MKNVLKISVLLLSLLPWSRSAQAQFQTAVFTETNNPTLTGSADRAYTINAYSYSNVTMDAGGVYTLNIHAWNGDPANPSASSIAWNQIDNTGSPYMNQLLAGFTNKESVDIVLTQTPQDSVCALVVYYEPGVGHFMDTYVWEESSNYLYLRDTKPLSTSTNFGWIHIDANSLDSFVVTWEEGQRLYARGGQSKNISGNYPELASGKVEFLLPTIIQQPDVAMSNSLDLGQLMSHFAYIDFANNVYESRYSLNDIFVNAGSMTPVTALQEDSFFLKGANMPRIDCPDHSDYDDWSYVLEGRTGAFTYINAAVQAYAASPSPVHFFLSDGSLTDGGGSPVTDLTSAKGQYYPVVAYDADWRYIYYAWDLQDAAFLAPYSTNNAYIGFRMRYNGTLMTNRYWFLQNTPSEASYFAGIALSGQNDATDSFYMAFTKDASGYYIGCKNVEWGSPTTSFKPGATGIRELNGDVNIFAFPNPFHKGFTIYAPENLDEELFEATITDINGRIIKTMKGNRAALNKELSKNNLIAGVYLLDIQSPSVRKQLKLIKQ